MNSTEAQNQFGQLLDSAQREPVQIEEKGRPVAVVLSIEDFDRLNRLEEAGEDTRLRESIADYRGGRTIQADDLHQELQEKIQASRTIG